MARYSPSAKQVAWAALLILAAALALPSTALACHKGRAHGPHTCGPPNPGPGPGDPTMTAAFTDVSNGSFENWILSPSPRDCSLTSVAPDESTGTYTCDVVPSPSLPGVRPNFHLLDSDAQVVRGKNETNCFRWDGVGDEFNDPAGHSSAGRQINPDVGYTITWDSACAEGCSTAITLNFSPTSTTFSQNFLNVAGAELVAVGQIASASGPNPFRDATQVVDITEINITHFAAEKGRLSAICRWQFGPGDVTLTTQDTTPSP